jgi:hypothetical protein
LRIYAQIVGMVLILIGVVGLFLGERSWLGVLNVDILEDIVQQRGPADRLTKYLRLTQQLIEGTQGMVSSTRS